MQKATLQQLIKIPALCPLLQLVAAEKDLLESIKNLKNHNLILGTLMTSNKLLAAREEDEMSEQRYQFENDG